MDTELRLEMSIYRFSFVIFETDPLGHSDMFGLLAEVPIEVYFVQSLVQNDDLFDNS